MVAFVTAPQPALVEGHTRRHRQLRGRAPAAGCSSHTAAEHASSGTHPRGAALSRRAAVTLSTAAAAAAVVSRRQWSTARAEPLADTVPATAVAADAPAVFYVRPGPDDAASNTFGAVADAVAAAPAGSTVRIAPGGYYGERLILTRPIVLEVEPGGGAVTLTHDTELPYEATVQVECTGVTLRGLQVRHSSPSIAGNYAVLVRSAGGLTLERCDVSSTTGSGLGVEGGTATAVQCRFTNCRRHGAALYGDLMGAVAGTTVLEDCTITANRDEGVILRDGADASLLGCKITQNGGIGILAVDSSLALVGCEVRSNKRGSLKVERSRELKYEATILDAPPVLIEA